MSALRQPPNQSAEAELQNYCASQAIAPSFLTDSGGLIELGKSLPPSPQ